HLLDVRVEIEPVDRVEDDDWAWFVGLDAEATRIGNALWQGEEPAEGGSERIMALFRLRFADPLAARPAIGPRPVWLILAMTPEGRIRRKPQTLLAGLPLRAGLQKRMAGRHAATPPDRRGDGPLSRKRPAHHAPDRPGVAS